MKWPPFKVSNHFIVTIWVSVWITSIWIKFLTLPFSQVRFTDYRKVQMTMFFCLCDLAELTIVEKFSWYFILLEVWHHKIIKVLMFMPCHFCSTRKWKSFCHDNVIGWWFSLILREILNKSLASEANSVCKRSQVVFSNRSLAIPQVLLIYWWHKVILCLLEVGVNQIIKIF